MSRKVSFLIFYYFCVFFLFNNVTKVFSLFFFRNGMDFEIMVSFLLFWCLFFI
ncbi:hypothetical protein GLOIN_2v1489743 [Rhizophagus irregularis DAOM 181602=DAOM 197198]|uniref:Uncharacterized protein n=1 Tax=Rhizophagus irregularis (strain DAOM 181602 / DAOM 197198 / MUCL 43194) TaxID=747089 RepID=A0A2P4QZZ4_RHIID|nr:hypothetical protein GLOIN_2v1489743 [Rhizophagus irregularis DAOM 181602=DAOM 197198]POG83148.1 hypothetical protein GLOIN_2v1489743 [Rhizophagus irregularis DAOM 181602=DAOM 197198]|eukprot:XP_025190014.1 hypothetical protein GLOIN_2v1489743 [Rhizophagus irregularis DAOM 181602=DAOM 197198]